MMGEEENSYLKINLNEMSTRVCFEESFRKIYEDAILILNVVYTFYSLKLGCNFKVCAF